jgi:predicted dehydrogenase
VAGVQGRSVSVRGARGFGAGSIAALCAIFGRHERCGAEGAARARRIRHGAISKTGAAPQRWRRRREGKVMALKVAIVGCGQIADGHAGEINKIECARLVACCDLEPLMAEQLAVRFGVPKHYDDFERMLECERPDVVHIATPPESHLRLGLQAIDAGSHCYVEKPFALSFSESQQLIEHAESKGRRVTIGHTYEYDPPAARLRELVAAGVIGDPVHVESWFGYNLGGGFGKAILGSPEHWVHRLPGKLFHNNINHLLNKVLEFVDDEQPLISAAAFKRREKSFGDVRDDMLDELRLLVQGEKVTAFGTFTSHVRPVGHWARVYGTKNVVTADYDTRTVTLEHGPSLPSAIGRLVPGYARALEHFRAANHNLMEFARSRFHFFAGLNALFRRFYANILADAPLPIAYRDILRLAWTLDEVFRQVEEHTVLRSGRVSR